MNAIEPGDVMPWDVPTPAATIASVTVFVEGTTPVRTFTIAGDTRAEVIEVGHPGSTVQIHLGHGWAPDADQVAAADRLIAVITAARDRAQARIDAAAVPA